MTTKFEKKLARIEQGDAGLNYTAALAIVRKRIEAEVARTGDCFLWTARRLLNEKKAAMGLLDDGGGES